MSDKTGLIKKYSIRLTLLLLSLLAAFVIAEILLTILINLKIFPDYKTASANQVYDDKLLYVVPPHLYHDLDKNGFRNAGVPQKVDIVAIGDSMTYGYNALSKDAWPQRLASKSNLSVYNMGMGGWGPAQYYYVTDKALELEPSSIVVGFYTGNDLLDACYVFTKLDYWKNFAKDNNLRIDDCLKYGSSDGHWDPEAQPDLLSQLRNSVRYSNVFMALKQVKVIRDFISYDRDLKFAKENPDIFLVVDNSDINVILNVDSLSSVDQNSPYVKNGIELTKFFYRGMADRIHAKGGKMIVVFIPTKEDAFYNFLLSKGYKLSEKYSQSVSAERAIIADFSNYFKKLGVDSVDARSFMEAKIESKNQPLFLNYMDSHPTPVGYDAIAEAIYENVLK